MDGAKQHLVVPRALKRKNITKACEECRRRRAKCDGQKPSCGRCLSRNITCKWAIEEDGRQPAPKSYVLLLHRRIDLLERALRTNGLDVEASIARIAAIDSSTLIPVPSNHPFNTRINHHHAKQEKFAADIRDLSTTLEGALSLDNIVNFDEDGEHHYFGSTSGRLEFLDTTHKQHPSATQRSQARESTSIPERYRKPYDRIVQSVANDHPVADELIEHLEDLYFTWEHPWYQLVDRTLYKQSKTSNGRYSSPLLLYCILALGSLFSDRIEVRASPDDPRTAGRTFLDKAEVLLHYELKWPTLTTIQSLGIISQVYVANGSDAICWLYQGMADRLALDMGLNIDPGSLQDTGSMGFDEVQLRRRIYWALYCNDKLAASYTGRVYTMLDSQAAVRMPSTSFDSSEDYIQQVQIELIKVCRILENIFLTLYAPKPILRGVEASAFFHSCISELRSWSRDIHPSLRIDRSAKAKALPQYYTLHMVLHTAFILLAKYFTSRSSAATLVSKERSKQSTKFDEETFSQARAVCHEAAREICAIATKYRRAYGSFRCSPITATHCTLSASLVLLRAEDSGDQPSMTDSIYSELCLDVLQELSVAWTPAGRFRSRLKKLYQQRHGHDEAEHEVESNTSAEDLHNVQNDHSFTSSSHNKQSSVNDTTLATMNPDETQPPDLDRLGNDERVIDALASTGDLNGWDWDMHDFPLDGSFQNDLDNVFLSNQLPHDYTPFHALQQNQFHEWR